MQHSSKWQTHLPYLKLETLVTYKFPVSTRCHGRRVVSKRASYAHALSPMERDLGYFLWDPVPLNVTISRQKIILLLKLALSSDLGSKNIVCMITK